MRYVNRKSIKEPLSLEKPSDAVRAEKVAAQKYYGTYNPLDPEAKSYGFKQYKGHDVQVALRSLFQHKCAYCESDVGDSLEIEHFRPKGGVTEDPTHPGYWWLAHNWSNLLPSCPACNQKRYQHLVTEAMTVQELTTLMAKKAKGSYGKANQFPILGVRAKSSAENLADEKPLLIDPTADDPDMYIAWAHTGDFSVALAKTADEAVKDRALHTISIFALNRANLVRNRTRILTELRFQAAAILKDLEEDVAKGGMPDVIARALDRAKAMRRFHNPGEPYSAMAKAFVDQFVADLRSRVEK